ncbi:hypothetical protein GXN76_11775 [Kroppenstedtia pulmonis]|uniref:Uncharacterized protein n=1 Tax=Kroppenstedtia pulmonis TaxID=1380685 RepID=A0A7D4CNZ3_9BACL|nr:hypothetical protein [Kroppenstedtia pulmonis]QKG85078.1 hypothetical protein GXN76_11775 [Kroppenstedtia pulmonis]
MRTTIARWIMVFCAFSAAVAFVTGVEKAFTAPEDQKIVELWRLFGFIVFAAIFSFLAMAPLGYPGIWEIVIFHKLAMAVCALFFMGDNVDGAGFIALIDGLLAILIITAYLLSKGYTSWKTFGQK